MANYPKFDISSLELKNIIGFTQVLSISFRESELKVLMVKVREIIFLRRAQVTLGSNAVPLIDPSIYFLNSDEEFY